MAPSSLVNGVIAISSRVATAIFVHDWCLDSSLFGGDATFVVLLVFWYTQLAIIVVFTSGGCCLLVWWLASSLFLYPARCGPLSHHCCRLHFLRARCHLGRCCQVTGEMGLIFSEESSLPTVDENPPKKVGRCSTRTVEVPPVTGASGQD